MIKGQGGDTLFHQNPTFGIFTCQDFEKYIESSGLTT